MPQVIALFGAGPGLGTSVARRFGREGYAVALVARRLQPLEALAAELAADGIDAAAFSADLADQASALAAIEAIRERFGRIDVVYYAPTSTSQQFTAARELRAADLRPLLELLVLTPVEITRAVLPELIERGDGAILIAHGASAVHPMPELSGIGPAMAATRNWLYSLNAELSDTGVYVGTLAIGAMIVNSAFQQAAASGAEATSSDISFPLIEPDDLAEQLWEMTRTRDRVEVVLPPAAA